MDVRLYPEREALVRKPIPAGDLVGRSCEPLAAAALEPDVRSRAAAAGAAAAADGLGRRQSGRRGRAETRRAQVYLWVPELPQSAAIPNPPGIGHQLRFQLEVLFYRMTRAASFGPLADGVLAFSSSSFFFGRRKESSLARERLSFIVLLFRSDRRTNRGLASRARTLTAGER